MGQIGGGSGNGKPGVGGAVGSGGAGGGKPGIGGAIGGAGNGGGINKPGSGGGGGKPGIGGALSGGGASGGGANIGKAPAGGGGGMKMGIGNVVGGSAGGGGGSKLGVSGVIGTGMGNKGKKSTTSLGAVDLAVNQAYNQLPTHAQGWVHSEASMLAASKHFTHQEYAGLLHRAAAMFPGTDPSLVVAVVRMRALQASAGGAIRTVYSKSGGPTAFQNQLIRGGS